MGRHEFLEAVAVADCAVEIEGDDLDDLFATAARVVAEVMVDPATVRATTERRVELAAPSLDLLLYDWLSELIYVKDSEQLVFPVVEARVSAGSPCRQSLQLVVHRKGATRSFGAGAPDVPAAYREVGQPVIIAGSMETGSALLVGTAHSMTETFGSTAHGAGRTMSRAIKG